jgi:hypothetical protein
MYFLSNRLMSHLNNKKNVHIHISSIHGNGWREYFLDTTYVPICTSHHGAYSSVRGSVQCVKI